ncbi:MAG: glycosyl hydrolase [Armatimonadetes bacterium]|nr:glycosyl hydrolase [Armatimonadota bacterium]
MTTTRRRGIGAAIRRTGTGFLAAAAMGLGGAQATPAVGPAHRQHPFGWDRIGVEARPGGFWWWLGSSVSKPEISRQLRVLKRAGFGAMLVCPIYAYKDPVLPAIPYLSDQWIGMLRHTLEEGRRLGMPIDMTMGGGWPMGGPWVTRANAERDWRFETLTVSVDAARPYVVQDAPGKDPIECVTVCRDLKGADPALVVEPSMVDGKRAWPLPTGQWKVLVVRMGYTHFDVYVGGPGGVGPVIDYWSPAALANLVEPLDRMLAALRPLRPRAAFCDSYEGRQGTTPGFLSEFQRVNGYDLRPYLHQFLAETGTPGNVRLWHDYRQVCAGLHIDFVKRWTAWARGNGMTTRYQYMGDPANPVDTSMQAGIHEDSAPFSSSAAHLAGHRLVSHETFTWGAGQNFIGSLDWFRKRGDSDILAGTNHMIYHGVPFTPAAEPWPGPMYYAGGNFSETQPWFPHIRSLNDYFARLQHLSQSAEPDPDVLVIWPEHDMWNKPNLGGFKWGQPFVWRNTNSGLERPTAAMSALFEALGGSGIRYDIGSDRLICEQASVVNGRLRAGKMTYRALVLPDVEAMSARAIARMEQLARQGATILFVGRVPSAVPHGLPLVQKTSAASAGLRSLAAVGADAVLLAKPEDAPKWLAAHGLRTEGMPGVLTLWRGRLGGDAIYFVKNQTNRAQRLWVPLARSGRYACVGNPRTGQVASAAVRSRPGGGSLVRLSLQPTEMLTIRLSAKPLPAAPAQPEAEPAEVRPLAAAWRMAWTDTEGRPQARSITDLRSWTEWPDLELFSGVVTYTTEFDLSAGDARQRWLLDVGELRESAAVTLNGRRLGDLWTTPFQVDLTPALRPGRNRLSLAVANLAQNRVVGLVRRGGPWQKWNLEENDFQGYCGPLRLSSLTPLPSGLLGPVTLLRFAQVGGK